jgi:glutathione S-transferase
MKLYYYKGACSLSVRIILNELEIKCSFESIKELQTKNKLTEGDIEFSQISPKNQIPVLELDDGRILTECSTIMLYLADLKNDKNLTGSGDNLNKYRVLEWLNFISTELHKNFVPIISPIVPINAKPILQKILLSKIKYIESELQGKDFITTANFTLADAYLFTVLSWFHLIQIPLEDLPNINKYFNNLKFRPSIANALKEEEIAL